MRRGRERGGGGEGERPWKIVGTVRRKARKAKRAKTIGTPGRYYDYTRNEVNVVVVRIDRPTDRFNGPWWKFKVERREKKKKREERLSRGPWPGRARIHKE